MTGKVSTQKRPVSDLYYRLQGQCICYKYDTNLKKIYTASSPTIQITS